jgi:hypothetical protein
MNEKYKFNNDFINVIELIYNNKYNFTNKLNYFHEILDTKVFDDKSKLLKINELGNDRNSVLYNDYHTFVDNNVLFNNVYYKFIQNYVKPMFSNEKIIIQKTPNLRISFPNSSAIGQNKNLDKNDIIGIHKDTDFGHHENVVNFIIPITEMFDTNSIYYEPYMNSLLDTDEYKNLILNTNEFFMGEFSNLYHFNKINKTGYTRMSLDFRVMKYEDYFKNIDYFKNTKFEIGNYYYIL